MELEEHLRMESKQSDILEGTTMEVPYIGYLQRPETYIVPVIFALIFTIGVLGNGTLVFIFLRHRTMRNVPNMHIFSLALGDLLVIVTCVPFTSTVYTFESWPYGELICKISETVKDISIGVSVFTLTVLSGDRFLAVVDPLRKLATGRGTFRALRCTIFIAAVIWLLATLCAVPAAMNSHIRMFNISSHKSFQVCYPFQNEDDAIYIVTAKFVVYYAVPMLTISIFYVLMARHLILSTRNLPVEETHGQQARREVRARKKAAKMVVVIVLVFAVCFFPQHAFMLWFYWDQKRAQQKYNSYWHALRIIGFCLSFINSCINPIALYFVSGTFRKYFNRYLLYICASNQELCNGTSVSTTSRLKGRQYFSQHRSRDSTTQTDLETTLRFIGSSARAE